MRYVFWFGLAIVAVALFAPAWAVAGEAEDEAVAQRIARNLKNGGRIQGYTISVAVRNGTAWLKGEVRSDEQIATALRTAQQTEGVQRVMNGLTIAAGNPTLADPARSSAGPKALLGAKAEAAGQGFTANRRAGAGAEIALRSDASEAMWSGNPLRSNDESPDVRLSSAELRAEPTLAPAQQIRRSNVPLAYAQAGGPVQPPGQAYGQPIAAYTPGPGRVAPVRFDQPNMPAYSWPSYASHPNYAGLTYPKQYSPTAWPFIGPFYPYPQVPLGWRKVTLEWDDGWWMLDFKD